MTVLYVREQAGGLWLQCSVGLPALAAEPSQLQPLLSLISKLPELTWGCVLLAQSLTFRRHLYKMEYSILGWRFSPYWSFFSSSDRALRFRFSECFCQWPSYKDYEGEENYPSPTARNARISLACPPPCSFVSYLGNSSWVFLSPAAWLWGQPNF